MDSGDIFVRTCQAQETSYIILVCLTQLIITLKNGLLISNEKCFQLLDSTHSLMAGIDLWWLFSSLHFHFTLYHTTNRHKLWWLVPFMWHISCKLSLAVYFMIPCHSVRYISFQRSPKKLVKVIAIWSGIVSFLTKFPLLLNLSIV